MSEDNRQAQLRTGLVQYVGSMIINSDLDPKDSAQVTAAALCEEAAKLAVKENGGVDFYVAKPLLRAVIYLYEEDFKHMMNEMKKNNLDPQMAEAIQKKMDNGLAFLKNTIEAYKEKNA